MKKDPQRVPFVPTEQLFHTVCENVDDLVAIVDIDGRRLYNSPAYKALLGDPEALRGSDSFQEIHPDDRENIKHLFQETISTGIGRKAEYRFLMHGGNVRYVESRGILLRDEKGKPSKIVIISHDITERRRSEKELRLLAQAVSCTKDAFCLTDLHNNLVFVNPAFCEIYGYSEKELLGQNIAIIRSPNNPLDTLNRILPGTQAGGWNGEVINRRKDGTDFTAELWTSVVRDETGQTTAYVGIARDISERKKTDELLRENEERLRAIVDNEPECVKIVSKDGILLQMNPAGLAMIEAENFAEVAGKSIYPLMTPETRDAFRAMSNAVFEGQKGNLQYEIVGLKGTHRWLETHAVPLRNQANVITSLLGVTRDITKRKEAEKLLQENETKYRLLFEANPEAMWVYDLETLRFLAVNDAATARYGYSEDEFLQMTINDIRSPENTKTEQQGKQLLHDGRTSRDFIHRKKDGTLIDVEIRAHPIDFSGRKASLVIAKDVTERNRAQRVQEAVYRIGEAPDRASTLDSLFHELHEIVGTVMPANNFYIALYDEKEETISFPYFVDEVDTPSPPKKLGKGLTEYVLRTGKSLLCTDAVLEELQRLGEAELVGEPSPIWLGVPLIGDQRPIGVMVVQHYSDAKAYGAQEQQILEFVSSQIAKAIERKRAEEMLRVSEEKYRTLFEESHDGIFLSTADGKLVDVNRAGVEMFGYSSHDELMKADIVRELYFNPDDRETFRQTLQRQGFVHDFEFAIKRKDGQKRVVLESVSAVRDVNGQIMAYRGFLRDVTERKKLEDQLRQAQKMEGIGTLAGGIAHDFNNLLGIILGYSTLLGSGKLDSERFTQSVETINRAVQRGADLVRQLLTFARKSDPSFTSINVNDTVSELTNMLGQTFPKTIVVQTELAPSLPAIVADTTQLHQALLNLCVNSRDAMMDATSDTAGKGTLTLITRTVSGHILREKLPAAIAEEYVGISVKDTGMGMDEATRSRVFEPFFTTKELGRGTGLGLAVVYGVTNSHHGFVDVESVKGRGTTFHLYFPVPAAKSVVTHESHEQSTNGESDTILIVEDEPMLLDLLKCILEDQGYRILTAKDGQEGIETYLHHSQEISLVLSDMGLPRLGGWEMFLKMKEKNPKVKAILASGYFDPNLKLDMLKAGAKDFMQKPYVAEVILKRIREVIDDGEH